MNPTTVPPKPETVVLWCRQTKRHKWREIGRAATGPAALALMDTSGIHGGSWMRLPLGEDPNTKAEVVT